MMKFFKIVAFLEGISLLVLFFNMLIIKPNDFDIYKMLLFPIGMAHGILFILYIALATLLKIENDPLKTGSSGISFLPDKKSDYSFGIDYAINNNLTLSFSHERGNYSSFKFVYKNNPKKSFKTYEYKKAEIDANDNKYDKLVKNLEENGIGVNKITETASSLGLELTQFIHPNFNLVEDIITQASIDAGIKKNIKKDLI